MALHTRFTSRFGVEHPIALAPKAAVADWNLASAVGAAGGFGIFGGGHTDPPWLDEQLARGPIGRLGVGVNTGVLAEQHELLHAVIERRPAAIMLSFGDTPRYANTVHAGGIPLICQIQTVGQARAVIDNGADVIVAHGGEDGMARQSSFTLIPAVADLLSQRAPDTVLLAAGGIADGRGLAAALALGADGAALGTRFWAAAQSPIPPGAREHGMRASGETLDILRQLAWPEHYLVRRLRIDLTERDVEVRADLDARRRRFENAVAADDYTAATIIVAEAIGQISRVDSVTAIVEAMVSTADAILGRSPADASGGWTRCG